MADVHVPATAYEQLVSPVELVVDAALLPGLGADCSSVSVADRAFWVDGCSDPVQIWIDAVGTAGAFTVTVSTDDGAEPDPGAVFPLFDAFDGAVTYQRIEPSGTQPPIGGFTSVAPVALQYNGALPDGGVVVVDTANDLGTVSIGCGPADSPTSTDLWWFAWTGTSLRFQDTSSKPRTTQVPGRTESDRILLDPHVPRIDVAGQVITATTDDACSLRPTLVVMAADGAAVERVFLRPAEPRVGELHEEPDTDTDTDADTDTDTDTDTDSAGPAVITDPGCACGTGGGTRAPAVVLLWVLRRRGLLSSH